MTTQCLLLKFYFQGIFLRQNFEQMMIGKQIGPLPPDSEEHSHFCHGEYINHRTHPSLLNTQHFLQSYNFAER